MSVMGALMQPRVTQTLAASTKLKLVHNPLICRHRENPNTAAFTRLSAYNRDERQQSSSMLVTLFVPPIRPSSDFPIEGEATAYEIAKVARIHGASLQRRTQKRCCAGNRVCLRDYAQLEKSQRRVAVSCTRGSERSGCAQRSVFLSKDRPKGDQNGLRGCQLGSEPWSNGRFHSICGRESRCL